MHKRFKETKTIISIIYVILFLILLGCETIEEREKYRRPEWLAGKVFTQIKEFPELSLFVRCLERTGYDTLMNKSGVYTVFAPNNDAVNEFLSQNGYPSVDAIPVEYLETIVKYHILQNPWSKEQLMSVDIYGWIDTLNENNDEPRGFKRETLLQEKELEFQIAKDQKNNLYRIVSIPTANSLKRKVVIESRKYAPLFYNGYFKVLNLNRSDDFNFYFNRLFEQQNDLYFVNAQVVKQDIFAENGFIHIVDKVVPPLKTGYQILATDEKFSKFLDLIHLFPQFDFNLGETNKQPGAAQGQVVDSLFNLSFPSLAFDLTNERTRPPKGTTGLYGAASNVTTRYHYAIYAPVNSAMEEFENNYLKGADKWGSFDNAPLHIKRMFVNAHMANSPIYLTNIKQGFYNAEKDLITIDQNTIIEKQFGSNCSFMAINKVIPPRALTSITGPVYLYRDYSSIMYAIEASGLLTALKDKNENYLFYVESDSKCRIDSSLLVTITEREIQFDAWVRTNNVPGAIAQRARLSVNDLRTLILNQVGIGFPKGLAKKEYIPTLGGNFLIIDNETGEVSGTAPTTDGYQGSKIVKNFPVLIGDNADNGKTYSINNWFQFSSPNLFTFIQTNYPVFHNLMKKAGLVNEIAYLYRNTSENENYTVFVPSDSVLTAYNIDTVSVENLKNLLRLHFIQGEIIFTDGKKPANYYETTRIDEISTQYTTVFSKIYIKPETDAIKIIDKNESNYVTVNLHSTKTNRIVGRSTTDSQTIRSYISNGVVHEINKVLIFNDLKSTR